MEDKSIFSMIGSLIVVVLALAMIPLVIFGVKGATTEYVYIASDYPDDDYIYLSSMFTETKFDVLLKTDLDFTDAETFTTYIATLHGLDYEDFGDTWYFMLFSFTFYKTNVSHYETYPLPNILDIETLGNFELYFDDIVQLDIVIAEI